MGGSAEIKLHKIKNRFLVIDSINKVAFRPIDSKQARNDDVWSWEQKLFPVSDLLSKSDKLALKAFHDLVFVFNWDNPPTESLKDDQRKFLEGRI